MNVVNAKKSLDKIINKARVHLYKPIQVAEILYRDRVYGDIELNQLDTYRNISKKWRDEICIKFLGRTSTSSARYQDDVFNENATPPKVLSILGEENRRKNGVVEAYIYKCFKKRHSQMTGSLNYCLNANKNTFVLTDFLNLFWNEPGLKRSIDKIYEIIVYSLFAVLVEELSVSIEISLDLTKKDLLIEFEDFAKKVICIDIENPTFKTPARLYRVGVTNAADRGLDIWANFGPAIQIKHLTLDEELAEDIVDTVQADRIVIVCKNTEKKIITSLLNQIGWKSRIQSIITENDLISWYERALKGSYSNKMGDKLLNILAKEIKIEFPSSIESDLSKFFQDRAYSELSDSLWGE